MKAVVAKSLMELSNQYPPMMGVPELRQVRWARCPVAGLVWGWVARGA